MELPQSLASTLPTLNRRRCFTTFASGAVAFDEAHPIGTDVRRGPGRWTIHWRPVGRGGVKWTSWESWQFCSNRKKWLRNLLECFILNRHIVFCLSICHYESQNSGPGATQKDQQLLHQRDPPAIPFSFTLESTFPSRAPWKHHKNPHLIVLTTRFSKKVISCHWTLSYWNFKVLKREIGKVTPFSI